MKLGLYAATLFFLISKVIKYFFLLFFRSVWISKYKQQQVAWIYMCTYTSQPRARFSNSYYFNEETLNKVTWKEMTKKTKNKPKGCPLFRSKYKYSDSSRSSTKCASFQQEDIRGSRTSPFVKLYIGKTARCDSWKIRRAQITLRIKFFKW